MSRNYLSIISASQPVDFLEWDGQLVCYTITTVNKGNDNLDVNGTSSWTTCNAYTTAGSYIPSQDFKMEFELIDQGINENFMVGVTDDADVADTFTDIDFVISVKSGGAIVIRENGSTKVNDYGSTTPGDTFKIESISGTVKYYQNEVLIYTSLNSPSSSNKIKTSFFGDNEVRILTWE